MKYRKVYLIIFIILINSFYTELSAQIESISIDFGIGRKMTLRDLNQNKYAGKFMYTNASNLSSSVHVKLKSQWGIWGRYAFDIHNDSKNNKIQNASKIMNLDTDKYYLRSISGYNATAILTYEFGTGIFYSLNYNKLAFMPFIGIGISNTYVGDLSYTIKEKDTNNAYNIHYNYDWNDDEYTSGFAELGLNVNYNIGHFYIGAGFRLQQYFKGSDFHIVKKDHYDYTVLEENKYKAQAPIFFQTDFRIGFTFKK